MYSVKDSVDIRVSLFNGEEEEEGKGREGKVKGGGGVREWSQ